MARRIAACGATGISGATEVDAGEDFTGAIMCDGTVRLWGDNRSGELGNGSRKNSNVPVPVAGLVDVSSLAPGMQHVVALTGAPSKLNLGVTAKVSGTAAAGRRLTVRISVCPAASGQVSLSGHGSWRSPSFAMKLGVTVRTWVLPATLPAGPYQLTVTVRSLDGQTKSAERAVSLR